MILHEKKLILDPDVFSDLTPDMLIELEKMGARKALSVLTGHLVKILKARRKKEKKDKEKKKDKDKAAKALAKSAADTAMVVDAPAAAAAAAIVASSSATAAQAEQATGESELVDIMGDSEPEGPTPKKRRIDDSLSASTSAVVPMVA